MDNETATRSGEYRLVVYGHPPHSGRDSRAVGSITELVCILREQYAIELPLRLIRGSEDYPRFASFLTDFLDACRAGRRHVDIMWIHNLCRLANDPAPQVVDFIRQSSCEQGLHQSYRFDFSFLRPWLDRILEDPDPNRWGPPPLAQFLATSGLEGRTGQGGPWGTEFPAYPRCTAIERNGQPESVYHAFLHLFGVGEGYDPETTQTKRGCEDCWMQWVPTSGSRLCEPHQRELRDFLAKVGT